MRGLFFKIFAIFWLAQSLIFVISTTFIVRQRFPSPNIVSDALDSNLQHDGNVGLLAYEQGGCASFAENGNRHEPSGAMLLQPTGNVVCRTSNALSLPGLLAHFPNRVEGRRVGASYVWLVPVLARNDSHYEYVWFQPPPSSKRRERHWSLLHYAFPQLPVAIAIGGLTTFVLVLLFSRPLVRLRRAARELAQGNLSARVEEPPSSALRSHSDEFQGLVHDFNHMAERLESLVGAQRLLLRDVSHELRSPLSRLSVALELAREDAGPELGEHLTRIEREGEKLNQLIGQLLTLSSMEARDGVSAFRSLSLNNLCKQLLPDAEYEAQRRPCQVRLVQNAECTIMGDWDLLYRAIENVVRNAIRYTAPNTEVTIQLRATAAEEGHSAVIEVTDCGPGIPDAELEHIFRPFYRVDEARSSATGGFGVGLAITERAVRLHGGTLRAVNRTEGGTSIEFLFPLKVEN
ncbi:HAMP domain-containing protein [Granulicella sp. 5B5]|uniref:ATP-binding protein n=1 Tax=Granulicella sp. 5B5 TaxID=1617967 RepID=UPI0015F4259B|nr:ATP-binding protein [Granulicella sp. 5B5]QMV19117.1 HAMP domain-containing protein [Granulicella sp. 5B5]